MHQPTLPHSRSRNNLIESTVLKGQQLYKSTQAHLQFEPMQLNGQWQIWPKLSAKVHLKTVWRSKWRLLVLRVSAFYILGQRWQPSQRHILERTLVRLHSKLNKLKNLFINTEVVAAMGKYQQCPGEAKIHSVRWRRLNSWAGSFSRLRATVTLLQRERVPAPMRGLRNLCKPQMILIDIWVWH